MDDPPGTLDNIPFYIICLKEPDIVMSLMSTYGTKNRMDLTTKRKYIAESGEQRIKLKYPEVVYNYYEYCYAVDDNDNMRIKLLSIEQI